MIPSTRPLACLLLLSAALTCARAQNVLTLLDVTGSTGDTVWLVLSVDNADPFTGFQCDVHLGSALSYVDGSASLTGRAAGSHTLNGNVLGGNRLRLLCFSMSSDTFSGSSGAVCSLSCEITAASGTHTIELRNCLLSGTESTNIITDAVAGTLNVDSTGVHKRESARRVRDPHPDHAFDVSGRTVAASRQRRRPWPHRMAAWRVVLR